VLQAYPRMPATVIAERIGQGIDFHLPPGGQFSAADDKTGNGASMCPKRGIPWKVATDLGQVAFVFPLLDGRRCNRGVKQSASSLPPSKWMCGRGSGMASSRRSEVRSILRKVGFAGSK
jgi:hypothetical protein